MTHTLQTRKPGGPGRRNGSANGHLPRPGKKRRLPRGSTAYLLAMTYGCVIALLVVTVGLTTLARDGTAVGQQAVQLQSAGGGDGHGHGGGQEDVAKPNIEIEAQHVGNLVVNIRAEVSMNDDKDPLVKAKVAAYTDMVQMPGAHRKGPLVLQPTPGVPGSYETTTTVQMPGDYRVRIVVSDPVQGEKSTTVPVGIAYGNNQN